MRLATHCKGYIKTGSFNLIFFFFFNFWDRVKVWIETRTGVTLNLGPLEHILGYLKTDNFLPINVIILVVKTYIFSNSRMSKNLNIMELKQKIKVIYDEQKLVAKSFNFRENQYMVVGQFIYLGFYITFNTLYRSYHDR